jgi:hypothetical protein
MLLLTCTIRAINSSRYDNLGVSGKEICHDAIIDLIAINPHTYFTRVCGNISC